MARRRRRRGLLLELIGAAVILAVLLSQSVTGSFSPAEDPRGGGVAWQPGVTADGTPGGAAETGAAVPGAGPAAGASGTGQTGYADGPEAQQPEGGPVLYVVRAGDTLSSISSRHGVSVSDLWIANRLRNPHSIMPGQSLVIPSGPAEVYGSANTGATQGQTPAAQAQAPAPAEPVYHRVRSGESLWVIARRYGTTVAALCDTNGLKVNNLLKPGQRLEVPASATAVPSTALQPLLANWPVYGTITSPFGMRGREMHEGLDIAAPRGTPIVAASAGTVKSAGTMGNYGRTLILDHGNGISTLYAHCDKLLVS
ncbi:MAG: M23 family metallopeptidase, partial [Bacillota bacterium]|nr:M23 family metallopeptidase [Bacillota bacterium]